MKDLSNPVLLKAILGAEVTVRDAYFQAGRTLECASIVLACFPKTFLLGRRFVSHGGWGIQERT
jgi:hypothetical protein